MYKLLNDFLPYHRSIDRYTVFKPHYVSHRSPAYDPVKTTKIENCLGAGLYCAAPRYDMGIFDGKDILFEDLRQKCVYNIAYSTGDETNTNLYWNYMADFYKTCVNKTISDFDFTCSQKAADNVGLAYTRIEDCMTKSFKLTTMSDMKFTNNNTLLEEDYNVKNKWGINKFPSIMVNNKTIIGAWSAENLFEAVCAGFKNKPQACFDSGFFPPHSKPSEDFSFVSIVFIIILVILLNVIIIYICRKYVANRIHERVESTDISGRVNHVVTTYLALRDQN